MAPVTPPRATVTLLSTYEVGGPSSTTPGTLFPAGQPFPGMTHRTYVPPSVINDLCVRMRNLVYGHEALVKNMRTVMVSQAVQMEVIVGLSQQVQTLQTSLHGAELQNQQLQTRLVEMESRESTLMSYMLWMEERLAVLEKKLPGSPPGAQ
ncbi:hypothetical protein Tco_1481245 [Tanacetum coccineum]